MPEHSWKTDAHADHWRTIYEHAATHHTTVVRGGRHGNQVYPLEAFGDLMDAVDRHSEVAVNHVPRTFLDVGCGSGQLVAIASIYFGLAGSGIDYDAELVSAANSLFIKLLDTSCYAWPADALDFPAEDYSYYDVITVNRPFVGPSQQEALERKVFQVAKPGTYLVKLNNYWMPSRDKADFVASNNKGGIVVLKK